MKSNDYRGVFVAFDGPNGAGKTTLIKQVEERLKELGMDILVTNEPTDTNLGRFVREFSETHNGVSLACLVMCDRYEHLNNVIIPALKKGKLVISDRYVLSSLIFQAIDGVNTDLIMSICSDMLKPDLQIAVYADEDTLRRRLSSRACLTRFEKENQSKKELYFTQEGIKRLEIEGVTVQEINNTDQLEYNVNLIVENIAMIWRGKL